MNFRTSIGRLAVLGLGIAIFGSAYADNTVVVSGVGSSAMFSVGETAAITLSGGSKGTNAYNASAAAFVQDGSNPDERGNLSVVWDTGAANNRKIWLYLSVDSTVGVRSFFNKAKLKLPDTLVGPRSGYTTMPDDVVATIKGVVFNAGFTDITAADAKVATANAIRLGYSVANPVKGLASDGTLASVFPVDFSLANRSFITTGLGASPMIIFVNKTDATDSGLGSTDATNINRYQLAGFLAGQFTRTRDILIKPGLGDLGVPTFIREPLSGTYNTTEWCVPKSVYMSQEDGLSSSANNPANTTTPPFDPTNPTKTLIKGGRVRAIGTGSLVSWVNKTPNALGYAFWSFGNFSSATSTKYLTVDGADPVQDTYSDGSYPTSSAQVTFRNVANGGYPIWSLLRVVSDPNPPTDFVTYLSTITATNAGGNFVPKNNLLVFRSHRSTKDVSNPSNGNVNPGSEAGADAGGAVFPINADKDYFADTGLELVNLRLGQGVKLGVAATKE